MQMIVNDKIIESAFYDDAKLRKRVFDAISDTPRHVQLFEDLARYIERIRGGGTSNGVIREDDEPTAKKRRLENGVASNLGPVPNPNLVVVFEAKDLSFLMPLRKRLQLEISQDYDLKDHGRVMDFFRIRTRNPVSNETEYECSGSEIYYALRLPVPEKAQKQYNYCLIPNMGFRTGNTSAGAGSTSEPLVWTVNEGAAIQSQCNDSTMQKALGKSDQVLEDALEYAMRRSQIKVIYPDQTEFVSAMPESHRKSEKAYHVKAFRGSKDGYLFFLSAGIFFGFKKPLQFFPLSDIKAISYTSVLQRTFNLNICYDMLYPAAQEKEVEFSMIDQADFAGIDAYVKRHELQDASMAEARKAKRMNINVSKKGDKGDQEQLENEPGELQKAEQEMEDAEDEEEEDYDPGSEGQSDGSGTSSEDEEEYVKGGVNEVDLVEDELGSEAEEVEPEPEDQNQL